MRVWAMWLLLVVVMWAGVSVTEGVTMGVDDLPPLESPHRVTLDQEGAYVMLWTSRPDHIEIEVQVATRGYVGLGFSPSGGMKGADIVMAWVDDGVVFLQDRHAGGYMVPVVDDSQDVTLVGGYENDTHTVIRFSRPWDTCDTQHDMELGEDTMRVIWAYSYDDPTTETTMTIHNRRGTKSLYLREPNLELPPLTPDIKSLDVLANNLTLPDNLDTIYWCKIFKMSLNTKHHVIGYVPVIEAANAEYVHHIVVYQCDHPESEQHYEKWLPLKGRQCHTASMPISWTHCRHSFLGWAVGGTGDMMPQHVGMPVGETKGPTYFLMETHYDNPNFKQGVVDNSGLRLLYTEKLREHDAGMLMLGHRVHPNMIIPPHQDWLTVGLCPESCTRESIPEKGINLFQGILHSHLIGTSITIRHIRDGVELPIPMQDRYYDFNFQQTRIMREERTILPGDSLLVECLFNSTGRRFPTLGGLGTKQEMCLAYMMYYPRIPLKHCYSHPLMESTYRALGVSQVERIKGLGKVQGHKMEVNETAENLMVEQMMRGEEPTPEQNKHNAMFRTLIAKAPLKYANRSIHSILYDPETWADGEMADTLQRVNAEGRHKALCTQVNYDSDVVKRSPSFITTLPKFEPLKPEVSQCQANQIMEL